MAAPQRLVVFDALMVRALALNDTELFPDALAAFRIAFRGQRFRILLTDGIIDEYQKLSNKNPQFPLQPILNDIADSGRSILHERTSLNQTPVKLDQLPKRHHTLIEDSVVANAEYLVTKWPLWLRVAEQARTRYGLHIVTPAQFVELEG